MLYYLNNNTFFYDARNDDYKKISTYMRPIILKDPAYIVSISDKHIIRKTKIASFFKKEKIFNKNSNIIIYRNKSDYQYCENLISDKIIGSDELSLKFKTIYSTYNINNNSFFKKYISNHKSKLMKILNTNNVLELVKRFR